MPPATRYSFDDRQPPETPKLMQRALPLPLIVPAGQHGAAATFLSVFAFSPQARTDGRKCKLDHSHILLCEEKRKACSFPFHAQQSRCSATQGIPRLVQVAVAGLPAAVAQLGLSSRTADRSTTTAPPQATACMERCKTPILACSPCIHMAWLAPLLLLRLLLAATSKMQDLVALRHPTDQLSVSPSQRKTLRM